MYIESYRQKPLRVHSFLAGIPLHTLERVELPWGRDGMAIEEISDVIGFGGEVEMEVGQVTQAFFSLRTLIGRILRGDEAKELVESVSFIGSTLSVFINTLSHTLFPFRTTSTEQ
jgi:hypothetical protein